MDGDVTVVRILSIFDKNKDGEVTEVRIISPLIRIRV
jgi:hypothetical protein